MKSVSFGLRRGWRVVGRSRILLVSTSLLAAVIGGTMMLNTMASSFVANMEAEDGVVGGNARTVRHAAGASQGSAVLFGSGTSPQRKYLIEHGYDVMTAAEAARQAAHIDALPFDGITIQTDQEAMSSTPITLPQARSFLQAMPELSNVTHNFVIFRMLDSQTARPYDVFDDSIWNTIAVNSANLAQAAKETGAFDGIIIDTEYYGDKTYPWNYGTTTTPWTFSQDEGAAPGRQSAEAQAKSQARGKQMMDAMRTVWPDIVVLHLNGATQSEPASFTPDRMNGNNVAWANELLGPFVVGFVESAAGTQARVVDGGESYNQRTLSQFQNGIQWMKSGFPDYGGRIVPAGAVSSAMYKDVIEACIAVYDKDEANEYATHTAAKLQELLTYSIQTADQYVWFYSEAFDWRGTGWPETPVPQPYADAVHAAQMAANPIR